MWRWNGKGLYPLYHDLYGERERERGGLKRGKKCAEREYKMRRKREGDMKLKVTSGVLYGNEKGIVGRALKGGKETYVERGKRNKGLISSKNLQMKDS